MKLFFTFITLIIFQQVSCQISTGLYKQYGDSTKFSELLVSNDSSFTYKHNEGSCYGWYTVKGFWKQKEDSLILIDTSLTEDLTIQIDTVKNHNKDFITISIIDESGNPLPDINITWGFIGSDSIINFKSEHNGQIVIEDNFINLDKSRDSTLVNLRRLTIDCSKFAYEEYVNHIFYIDKRKYNLIVKIKAKPLLRKIERVTTYKITNDKLQWICQKYLNKQTDENSCLEFWGNFKFLHK